MDFSRRLLDSPAAMRLRRDYDYDLPKQQIAQTPSERRSDARLLAGDTPHRFADLAELLPPSSLIVANDARVRPARLRTTKRATGGAVELLLIEPTDAAGCFRALARASKPIRQGAILETKSGAAIEVRRGRAADGSIVVALPDQLERLCTRDGELPLPPYIERPDGPRDEDADRYQTVYAQTPGAIAAPTAGLHFTPELIEALVSRGHQWKTLTLHVGIGTFAPVRADAIDDHDLHSERFEIPDDTARALVDAQKGGRPIVAIGTTVVRALEAFALGHEAETSLFITPGFRFRVVSHLVTNFHLPCSSLLMLVCAFAGYEKTMASYRDAVARGFRFFSYGDAMLVAREGR